MFICSRANMNSFKVLYLEQVWCFNTRIWKSGRHNYIWIGFIEESNSETNFSNISLNLYAIFLGEHICCRSDFQPVCDLDLRCAVVSVHWYLHTSYVKIPASKVVTMIEIYNHSIDTTSKHVIEYKWFCIPIGREVLRNDMSSTPIRPYDQLGKRKNVQGRSGQMLVTITGNTRYPANINLLTST